MSPTMIRFFLATCISCVIRAESNINIETKIPLTCIAHWNVSSANMHHITFMWTHEHKVRNWLYKKTQTPSERNNDLSFANTSCAFIEYDTVVKVPQQFTDFIPSRVTETHVQKQVCAKQRGVDRKIALFENYSSRKLYITLKGQYRQCAATGRICCHRGYYIAVVYTATEAINIRTFEQEYSRVYTPARKLALC